MASTINNVMQVRKNWSKNYKKHLRSENLNSLKIKNCNPEIWSEMFQSKTRSKDLKTQKIQGCILKALEANSKITNGLLELKNSKHLYTTILSNNISTIVHDCTDSLTLISHVNTDLEQNRRDHIAYCPDNQYHALRKKMHGDSKFLFGDDLRKSMLLQIKSSFLHLKLLLNHNSSFKS